MLSERMLFDSDPSMVRYPGPNYQIAKAQVNGFAYYGTASPTLC